MIIRILSLLAIFSLVAQAAEVPFHVLRARFTGAITEYEFFPDGRLLLYYYQWDGTESSDDLPEVHFEPRFRVESLLWKKVDGKLFIQRGDKKTPVEYREEGKYVYFWDKAWEKDTKILFFDELHRYSGKKFKEMKNP